MKKFSMAAVVLFVLLPVAADAARLVLEPQGTALNNTYSIFLDGEEDNGEFDTIIFSARTLGSARFENLDPDGVEGFFPREPGEEFTFISAFLGAPSAFGGNGFTVLGQVVSDTSIEFTAGPLGQTIDTINGPNNDPQGLFLANVVVEGNAEFTAQLVSAGEVVATLCQSTFLGTCVPEPSSLTLAVVFGLFFTTRRSK